MGAPLSRLTKLIRSLRRKPESIEPSSIDLPFNEPFTAANWPDNVPRELADERYAHRPAFLQAAQRNRSILEIGPFFNPSMFGDHVSYADVFDTDELRRKSIEERADPERVPTIDYVMRDGSLDAVDRTFNAVFTSHCIEHQPDLIGHLNDVERVLEPGGLYFLFAPDARTCFDHYRPLSMIADVLEAFEQRRRTHALRTVIAHTALTTHNDPIRHWLGDHGANLYEEDRSERINAALAIFRAADGGYIDSHAWQFSPTSFASIVNAANAMGLTRLRLLRVNATQVNAPEFNAILYKPT